MKIKNYKPNFLYIFNKNAQIFKNNDSKMKKIFQSFQENTGTKHIF